MIFFVKDIFMMIKVIKLIDKEKEILYILIVRKLNER